MDGLCRQQCCSLWFPTAGAKVAGKFSEGLIGAIGGVASIFV